MFQGASSLKLDARGRQSVPARYRDLSSATSSGQLTPTRHPHGGLRVFPRAGITQQAARLGMDDLVEFRGARTQAFREAEVMKGERPDIFEDFSF